MTRPLIIISGSSGQHAAVVYEAARLAGRQVLGFVACQETSRPKVLDCSCIGGPEALVDISLLSTGSFIVAAGSNSIRQQISESLIERGASLETVVHPSAVVSPSASIGDGTVILAGAIIGTCAQLGRSCIVNHGASVDHNCEVGDYVNICPGVRLGGAVRIGIGVFAGLNSTILPGVQIGARSVLGAGAVVIRDVPPAVTVAGTPARNLALSGD